ncbi:MAG TPA: hypothetical protein DCY89_09760, partial [Gammaproteobacteria bacterium]|nr:hypothetical protein [Gammaproteobacteria bacterium]
GAALWGSLLFGSILSLTRLAAVGRRNPTVAWVTHWAYMLRASLVAYAVGGIFLGITYWDLFYQLVFCTVLMRAIVQEELAAAGATTTPSFRLRAPPPGRSVPPRHRPLPAHRAGPAQAAPIR